MDNLVVKAQRGDKQAFVHLMKEHELSLYKTAKAILKNDEDVADAMQDTIMTALEKIHTLKNLSYFKTWITRIIINKCNDILRKNSKVIQMNEYIDISYTEKYDLNSIGEEPDYVDIVVYGDFNKLTSISEVLAQFKVNLK